MLDERNMIQKELCFVTGLRPTTVSEMAREIRTVVILKHLDKLMTALEIKDINDVFTKEDDK
ncbi:helix-turn-helix domain-containing protein [Bacillus toyonensis]|uniref:helix-turn-helix domain-containing protein n=1 Tax=Bacillus toyonensis TaxID=155322 RepID=UPI003D3021E5